MYPKSKQKFHLAKYCYSAKLGLQSYLKRLPNLKFIYSHGFEITEILIMSLVISLVRNSKVGVKNPDLAGLNIKQEKIFGLDITSLNVMGLNEKLNESI